MIKVSIITPCFNTEKYLFETYRSLKEQTYLNWEWIVVDDCSTDKSYEILNNFAQDDMRIKVYQNNKNSGAAITRNNSLNKANGEYVAFLDCDDLWLPNKLKEQMEFINKTKADFTYHNYDLVNSTGDYIKTQNIAQQLKSNNILKYNPFATSSIVINREIIEKNKIRFKEHLRRRQDYIFWYEAMRASNTCLNLNKNLSKYRLIGGDSLSANKKKMAIIQWNILKEEFNVNPIERIYYFLHYVCHGVKKYFL